VYAWLTSLFRVPRPAGPAEVLWRAVPGQPPLRRDGVSTDGDAWRIEVRGAGSIPLFTCPVAGVDDCMLTYRARMKSRGLSGQAYLEMWCRMPGSGEFFSKGLNHPLQGTTGWSDHETHFYLKRGQEPDLLKLNVFAEGTGELWLRDVVVLKTPFA
jgi:hypothetical protein